VLRALSAAALALLIALPASADTPRVDFKPDPGRLTITVGGRPFATYVHADEKIPRPYFAHLHAPNGVQVTRNHPPVKGKDDADHDTFHPGLWLAFGELSGSDTWRNKARVVHEKFVEEPKGEAGAGTFAVANRHLAADGKTLLCREVCRYRVLVRPAGTLLVWDSTFTPGDGDLVFGDQEEMGLGVRVATALAVKHGGRIVNSDGRQNEKDVWGQPADWCDYGGVVDGQRVGVTLMPDPKNFRRSWFHARDYGVQVANPFGRRAFTQGERSEVVVKKGETFRLRFGVLVRGGTEEPDLAAAYKDFVDRLADRK
jgi:hypothetical protein